MVYKATKPAYHPSIVTRHNNSFESKNMIFCVGNEQDEKIPAIQTIISNTNFSSESWRVLVLHTFSFFSDALLISVISCCRMVSIKFWFIILVPTRLPNASIRYTNNVARRQPDNSTGIGNSRIFVRKYYFTCIHKGRNGLLLFISKYLCSLSSISVCNNLYFFFNLFTLNFFHGFPISWNPYICL